MRDCEQLILKIFGPRTPLNSAVSKILPLCWKRASWKNQHLGVNIDENKRHYDMIKHENTTGCLC